MFNNFNSHKIVSASLNSNGELEVVRQYDSHARYANNTPCPDRVIKEIYKALNGEIVLDSVLEGKHTPSYIVEEKIEFPESHFE